MSNKSLYSRYLGRFGVVLDLDSRYGLDGLAENDNVVEWTSREGTVFSQATESKQPTLAYENGIPYVRFTEADTNNLLSESNIQVFPSKRGAIIWQAKVSGDNSGYMFSNNGSVSFRIFSTSLLRIYDGSTTRHLQVGLWPTGHNLYVITRDGDTSYNYRFNGAATITAGTFSDTQYDATPLRIGSYHDETIPLQFDLRRLILLSTAPTASQLASVEKYLNDVGIAL